LWRYVFFQAIAGLWAAAVIGSWCNFLTVIYVGKRPVISILVSHSLTFLSIDLKETIPCSSLMNAHISAYGVSTDKDVGLPGTGFVCVHTLPVLYEKYEDQVDDFLYSLLGLLRDQYQKLDQGVLSKIPKGNMKAKKNE
jgi:hypothetical protein